MAPPIYDEQLRFAQGGDVGDNTAASVQPVAAPEYAHPTVTNRPTENLRQRTERLRQALETANYFADYDRALVLRMDGRATLTEPVPGAYELKLLSGDLWIYPALTPGKESGGFWKGGRVFCTNSAMANAWTPYSGPEGAADLILTAHHAHTGQRAYADGADLATGATRSVGANRITVALIADSGLAGGSGTIQVTITQTPKTHIQITYGTAGTVTTVGDLVSFINADRTSQGTYGVADYLFASNTSGAANPPTPFNDGVVQGAYDAEAHQVTAAALTAFFAAVDGGGNRVNLLVDGAGLAVGFAPGPVDTSGPAVPRGGRRQSIFDLPTDTAGGRVQNTEGAVSTNLFSTYREPEKIPGSVPIGKMIDGEFVFIDGTRLAVGELLELGESRTTWAALAATLAPTGASLVGYGGSGLYNDYTGDDAVAGRNIPVGTLEAALDSIPEALGLINANDSGVRRIGAEGQIGLASTGNDSRSLSVSAGSVREQIYELLNKDNGVILLGINGRVQEAGHQLQGVNPLEKNDDVLGGLVNGWETVRAVLPNPGDLADGTDTGDPANGLSLLQPLAFTNSSTDYLLLSESFTHTGTEGANNRLTLNGPDLATRWNSIKDSWPLVRTDRPLTPFTTNLLPHVLIKLTFPNASSYDGYYYLQDTHHGTSGVFSLRKLDGTSPDFTGVDVGGGPTLVSYATALFGTDQYGTRIRSYHATNATWASIVIRNPAAPLMDGYSYDQSTQVTSIRTRIAVGYALFQDPGGILRHTDNILASADKAVLSGNETGSPVNANGSHFHADEDGYGRVVMWATATDVVGLNGVLYTALPIIATPYVCPRAVPAGYARTAVILDIEMLTVSTSPRVVGDDIQAVMNFGAGTRNKVHRFAATTTAACGGTQTFQLIVPVDPVTNEFIFQYLVGSEIAVDTGVSALTVQEVGSVLIRMP